MSLIETVPSMYQVKEILNDIKSHCKHRMPLRKHGWKKLLENRKVHMAYLYFLAPKITIFVRSQKF